MTIKKRNTLNDFFEGIGGAAQIAIHMLFWFLLLKWRDRWGSTVEEMNMLLPGDELVQKPKVGYTHAITILKPKEEVWPWLAQIGQGRGGFYSYQWLENLVGCQIYNTDEILPEYQNLEGIPGFALHPEMAPIPIVSYKKNEHILLHGDSTANLESQNNDQTTDPENFLKTTWLFHIREIAPNTTRLISRWYADFPDKLVFKLGYGAPITGSIAFVMDRKMLKGIKKRVEAI